MWGKNRGELMIISTHSLTKRLTFYQNGFSPCWDISTHSLTKRLTIDTVIQHRAFNQNFNSQPHEEADKFPVYSYILQTSISTHSLTKRLTSTVPINQNLLFHFNSQPHEEADGENNA